MPRFYPKLPKYPPQMQILGEIQKFITGKNKIINLLFKHFEGKLNIGKLYILAIYLFLCKFWFRFRELCKFPKPCGWPISKICVSLSLWFNKLDGINSPSLPALFSHPHFSLWQFHYCGKYAKCKAKSLEYILPFIRISLRKTWLLVVATTHLPHLPPPLDADSLIHLFFFSFIFLKEG